MERWKELIVIMLNVRNNLLKADTSGLWQYDFPEVAATKEEVENIQKHLGIKLSDEYIKFLLCANGWKCFYQMVDLFGTHEFVSDKMKHAIKLLNIEIEFNESLKDVKEYLFPIAVSRNDKDLFIMMLNDNNFGEIIWLAGGEIDRFVSFIEFFESMIEYNKEELEEMLTE